VVFFGGGVEFLVINDPTSIPRFRWNYPQPRGKGKGGCLLVSSAVFFKKNKNSPIYVFSGLRVFGYLGSVRPRVCMDGFAAADTAAGRKVDGRQSGSLTPTTILTISQLLRDIRNENVFALYLPINTLPSLPYPRLPSLTRSPRSLTPRLRKAKAQNGGEGGKPIAGLSE